MSEKFLVTIVLSYSFEVEADNREQAEGLAIQEANIEYPDCIVEAVRVHHDATDLDDDPIEVTIGGVQ